MILPTVWDAWSAKLAVEAGFAALTVGSHPVADSIGKEDGEGMSFDDLTARVAQITGAVDVPISVDIESGYGEPPQRLIEGLLSAGAVGFNIEDTVHKEGKRLRTAEEHAALVGELRKAADAADVHVVINARTDLFLRQRRRRRRPRRPRDRAPEVGRRGGCRQPLSGRPPRSGHASAAWRRTAVAGQRDRAARPGRPRVVRPAGRRPDQLRSVPAARAAGRAEEILARWS